MRKAEKRSINDNLLYDSFITSRSLVHSSHRRSVCLSIAGVLQWQELCTATESRIIQHDAVDGRNAVMQALASYSRANCSVCRN